MSDTTPAISSPSPSFMPLHMSTGSVNTNIRPMPWSNSNSPMPTPLRQNSMIRAPSSTINDTLFAELSSHPTTERLKKIFTSATNEKETIDHFFSVHYDYSIMGRPFEDNINMSAQDINNLMIILEKYRSDDDDGYEFNDLFYDELKTWSKGLTPPGPNDKLQNVHNIVAKHIQHRNNGDELSNKSMAAETEDDLEEKLYTSILPQSDFESISIFLNEIASSTYQIPSPASHFVDIITTMAKDIDEKISQLQSSNPNIDVNSLSDEMKAFESCMAIKTVLEGNDGGNRFEEFNEIEKNINKARSPGINTAPAPIPQAPILNSVHPTISTPTPSSGIGVGVPVPIPLSIPPQASNTELTSTSILTKEKFDDIIKNIQEPANSSCNVTVKAPGSEPSLPEAVINSTESNGGVDVKVETKVYYDKEEGDSTANDTGTLRQVLTATKEEDGVNVATTPTTLQILAALELQAQSDNMSFNITLCTNPTTILLAINLANSLGMDPQLGDDAVKGAMKGYSQEILKGQMPEDKMGEIMNDPDAAAIINKIKEKIVAPEPIEQGLGMHAPKITKPP
jgi:hypothetical protein